MTDLIHRQQVIDALNMQAEEMSHWSERYQEQRRGVLTAVNIVIDCPSAQPEIIRCKDCAYCDSDVVDAPYGMTKKIFWCDRLYAGANENLIVEPDNFCSWAERREDG